MTTALITSYGKRDPETLRQSGVSAARHFDRLIILEERSDFGKEHFEASRFLLQGALSEKPSLEYRLTSDGETALEQALGNMSKGDFLFFFGADAGGTARKLEEQHGAAPVFLPAAP